MTTEPTEHPNLIEEARTLLSAYIDDEVTVAERKLVEDALDSSGDLKQELAALQQTVRLFQDLPRAKAPKPFTLTEADVGMVPTQHQAGSKGWFSWGQWWKPAFGGAIALTAAILVGLYLFNQNSVSEQSTTAMIAQAPLAPALESVPVTELAQTEVTEADSTTSAEAPQVDGEVGAEIEASSDASDDAAEANVADTQAQGANSETTPADQPIVNEYNEQASDMTREMSPNPLNRNSFQPGQGDSAAEVVPDPLATVLPSPSIEGISGATTEGASGAASAKVTADEASDLSIDAPGPTSEPLPIPPQESSADSERPFAPLSLMEEAVVEPGGFVIERQLILVQRPTLAIAGDIYDSTGTPLNNLHVRVRSADFCLVSGPSGPASDLADGAYNIEFAETTLPAEWQVSIVMGVEPVEISPDLNCNDDLVNLSSEMALAVNEVAEIRLDWRKVE